VLVREYAHGHIDLYGDSEISKPWNIHMHEVQSYHYAYIQTYVQYYSCICVYLTDVDECTDGVTVLECGVNAHCVNFVGSFNCSCLEGYEGNATTLCESKHSDSCGCIIITF